MMKEKMRKLLTAAAVVTAIAVGAGGTIAYLTDNESHTNSFTVGDVKIDLTEPSWPQEDTDENGVPDEAEDLVPNEEVAKDPKITNTGVNDAIMFLRVTVPVKDVTLIADDGTILKKDGTAWNGTGTAHEAQEIFWLKDENDESKDHANSFGTNWQELTGREFNADGSAVGEKVYVFGYKTAVAAGASTESLFEKVQLKNIIENEIADDEIQNIKIEAFAIQKDHILSDADGVTYLEDGTIDGSAQLTVKTLETIYDIFVNQNGTISNNGAMQYDKQQDTGHGQTEKEADTNNSRDLKDNARSSSQGN